MIEGNQQNKIYLLAYVAGRQESNPTIINHTTVMNAIDSETLKSLWLRNLAKCGKISYMRL